MKIKYLILLLTLVYHNVVWAVDSTSVKYLCIEDGLSNNAVTCIFQDRKGFMWFGTYDGLNKYDGYSFTVFRNIIDDTTSILDNHVYCIGADSKDNIWIGFSKGVSVYDPINSVFHNPKFRKTNNETPVSLVDAALVIQKVNDMVLVGTTYSGLIVYDKSESIGRQVLSPFKKETTYTVSYIEYDSIHNNIWLFVNGLGLCKYDSKNFKINLVAPALINCNSIFINSFGELFIGSNTGIYKLERNVFVAYSSFPKISVRSIKEDKQHTLWVATDGDGLWYLPRTSPIAKKFSFQGAQLNSNSVYDVYCDAEGRKWVGTLRGGVNLIEQNKSLFKTISYKSKKEKDVNDFIMSFCEDDKQNLWVGTDGSGLRYWDRRNNQFSQYIHSSKAGSISSNFITGIIKDSRNDIWISTWFGGINKFNRSSNSFSHYDCYDPIEKFNNEDVWFIYEDNKRRLWASTTNNGYLYLYNRSEDKFILFDTALINFQVMTEDQAGHLWGGNYNSLIRIDTTKKKHLVFDIGYPVRSIHEDKNHNFWIGTEGGGLLLFDRTTGKYKRLTTKDGLPNNAILRILEDKNGNLWLSTYFGLCRFNPVSKSFRNFTQADGLQSNQFSFNAAAILKTGEFLFGGIKGFNVFYPDSIYEKKNTPKLFLTGLSIDTRSIVQDMQYVTGLKNSELSSITIPFDKAVLALDFTAIEYSNPNKLKYAYLLQGWDKRWNVVGNNRTAHYTHLQEGNYIFYVKVMNDSGVWSNKQQLLIITVLPPWYRTWWAYLLYVLFITGVVYVIILYNKRQERLKYEVKLAVLNNEREKELTGKKTAFFTHISHEFRAPLTLIINPLEDLVADTSSELEHKKLVTIQRNAKRLLSLVDQLLLFGKADEGIDEVKVMQLNFYELCREVFDCFIYQAKAKNIEYKFCCHNQDMTLYVDREKMEIILFNLISNALKFTPEGGQVRFVLEEYEQTVRLKVSDTGYGIEPEIGNKLFERFYKKKNKYTVSKSGFGIGLFLVKQFVEAHNGNITYQSEVNKGTEFTVILPKGCAHFNHQDIIEKKEEKLQILEELIGDAMPPQSSIVKQPPPEWQEVFSEKKSILLVDDDGEMREYLAHIFQDEFLLYQAENAEIGWELAMLHTPDLIISDVMMNGITGVEFCGKIKADATLKHIPVVLLTASSSSDIKLKGIEGGAEDYITKPFEKELLIARVHNILESRNALQQYFFDRITLQKSNSKVSGADKEFLEKCIAVVEKNLDNEEFTVKMMMREMNLSHSGLYKKVKAISGQSINSFIRLIRLRKAAVLLLSSDTNISEASLQVGMADVKYFRRQFVKVFGVPPSEYVKKYKSSFNKEFNITEDIKRVPPKI